uniref:(northern house mosquito) hypothetical protein n=1 Tax=Culex pipiens TaxID=7175 RepID=A0A8D8IG84_CULPI
MDRYRYRSYEQIHCHRSQDCPQQNTGQNALLQRGSPPTSSGRDVQHLRPARVQLQQSAESRHHVFDAEGGGLLGARHIRFERVLCLHQAGLSDKIFAELSRAIKCGEF